MAISIVWLLCERTVQDGAWIVRWSIILLRQAELLVSWILLRSGQSQDSHSDFFFSFPSSFFSTVSISHHSTHKASAHLQMRISTKRKAFAV
eukprot:scaffold4000_cov87-Skeletonema_menzelii.AAC.1